MVCLFVPFYLNVKGVNLYLNLSVFKHAKIYKAYISKPQMREGLGAYADAEGFIDLKKVYADGKQSEFFPDILPELVDIIARDFPELEKRRIYFDNAATSQEPQSVRDLAFSRRRNFLRGSNHSKNSEEAKRAQREYELCKDSLKSFFHADNYDIGFTSGTTESSNLVSTRFAFNKGDLLILTEMEHTSQMVTARNFAKLNGADVEYVPVSPFDGRLDLGFLQSIVEHYKPGKILMNLVHVSNVTGIINPVSEIKSILGKDAKIYLDIAQSAGHLPINLDELDVDFAGASSHKMYGPMGVGALFVKKSSQQYLNNLVMGGGAVKYVTLDYDTSAEAGERFELGTRNLEGILEWKFAIDWLESIGLERAHKHETGVASYFISELKKIKSVNILGLDNFSKGDKTGVIAFNVGEHKLKNHQKVAVALDNYGISVRNGCFCARPYIAKLMGFHQLPLQEILDAKQEGRELQLPGAIRISFGLYNTLEEADKAIYAIRSIAKQELS